MPDDRVDEIRVHLKVARSRIRRAIRRCDEIHAESARLKGLHISDSIDDMAADIEGTDAKLRLLEAAYDVDEVDRARHNKARRRFRRSADDAA